MRSSLLLADGDYNTPGFLENKAAGRETLAAPTAPGSPACASLGASRLGWNPQMLNSLKSPISVDAPNLQ